MVDEFKFTREWNMQFRERCEAKDKAALEKKQEILKEATPALPLAARPGDFQKLGGQALALFQLEAQADDLYALSTPTPQPCGRDYTEKLLKL